MTLFLGGCRQKPAASEEKRQISEAKDSSFLFNGQNLNGWEITNFGPQGPVYVSGDAIILGMGDGCTGITWKGDFPVSGYEVTLEAKRVEGNDFFCGMTFPAGNMPCTFIVGGWGGTVVGLSSINGYDASPGAPGYVHAGFYSRASGIRAVRSNHDPFNHHFASIFPCPADWARVSR